MECLFDEIECRNGWVNSSADCKECSHYEKICRYESYKRKINRL
jgi:hypothetical protein